MSCDGVILRMNVSDARAVWNAIGTVVTLLEQVPDVSPDAPLYGQHDALRSVAKRLDHEINHAQRPSPPTGASR